MDSFMRIITTLFVLLTASNTLAAANAEEIKIIRVVNSSPITTYDLDLRKKIIRFLYKEMSYNHSAVNLAGDMYNVSLEDFALSDISEDIILKKYLEKIPKNIQKIAKTHTLEAEVLLHQIVDMNNLSEEKFSTLLNDNYLQKKDILEYLTKKISRAKMTEYVLEGITDVKEQEARKILSFSNKDNPIQVKYIEFDGTIGAKKQLENLRNNKKFKKVANIASKKAITSIYQDKMISEMEPEIKKAIYTLPEQEYSKIWKSQGYQKMIFLQKKRMLELDQKDIEDTKTAISSLQKVIEGRVLYNLLLERSQIYEMKEPSSGNKTSLTK
ncbi:hypothetical protein [Candidatus Sneabacter namystus]|uniref:PpiC domain-containing protein n=1 Tax=Candidatus Sneabacter namystus TaxID=2601646 RepID=A0A5C0UL11_9RICK|nr:hypothetical protein [Candidatus Sneabacter namystus]QEK39544.1 hypothetical protein FZC37_01150 [Candidatus Sneabacter namystus]